MKLPKELQKKKKIFDKDQLEYSALKKKLVGSFRAELRKITQNENRKILFKKAEDRSIFTDIIDEETMENEQGLFNAKTHWDESTIEFFLNQNDDNEYMRRLREFPENYIQLDSIIKYIARHEYGHTFITKSIYDLKSKGEREILSLIGVNNLKDIPKENVVETLDKVKNTPFFKCVEDLQNIDLVVLLKEFREFHANYTVLTKINDEIPKELLGWKYSQLELIIKNLRSRKDEIVDNIESRENYRIFKRSAYFYLLFNIIALTYEIYIFSGWDQLIPLFEEQNMINILIFIYLVHEIFENIAMHNKSYDSMIENLMDLGYLMEPIDFEKILFKNQIFDTNFDSLKEYKNKLAA